MSATRCRLCNRRVLKDQPSGLCYVHRRSIAVPTPRSPQLGPTTKTGRWLVSLLRAHPRGRVLSHQEEITARTVELHLPLIEAEAAAAERARITRGVLVAGMFEGCGGMGCTEERNDELAAVLAIVEATDER